jgi:uncharacterized membrane protein YesL
MQIIFLVYKRAIQDWWREFIALSLLNLAWLIFQLLVITGPPATATMYLLARRVIDLEDLSAKEAWSTFRTVFFPAWKWGFANLVILIVMVSNYWAYQDNVGLGWSILRFAWACVGMIWFSTNLFYWPLWIAQTDRRMRTTLRNGLVILLRHPGFALLHTALSAAFLVVSAVLSFPLATITISWIALSAIHITDLALQDIPRTPVEHPESENEP